MSAKQIIALSGGIGGAKLVLGLSRLLPPERLVVVTNTGDDFEHLGLRICPDIDTVLYTLAGLADSERGWGRADETWTFMHALQTMGGEDWFNLGDGDLALHVLRTNRLAGGASLSEVTADIAASLSIKAAIVPMSDQYVATVVNTPDGALAFQHYFVRDRCAPTVTGFAFDGVEAARPAPALTSALNGEVAAIVIAPSNPYVSVDPILAVPGLRRQLRQCEVPIVAVSPIVGGDAIKGPAAKMMRELGVEASALEIAMHYQGFVDGLVIDEIDSELAPQIAALGMAVEVGPTVMRNLDDRIKLADLTVSFAARLEGRINR